MKGTLIAVLAVLMVVGLVLTAEALDVYDGTKITDSSVTAVASGANSGTAQTILIKASIPASLTVALSATQINWTINKQGTFQTKAIDITYSGLGSSDVSMVVAYAADLVKDGGATLATYYALKADKSILTPTGLNYETAKNFNGTHIIKNADAVKGASIWNKIAVLSGTKPGDYLDDFTVTFSQAL